jgi:hypothetical protein
MKKKRPENLIGKTAGDALTIGVDQRLHGGAGRLTRAGFNSIGEDDRVRNGTQL